MNEVLLWSFPQKHTQGNVLKSLVLNLSVAFDDDSSLRIVFWKKKQQTYNLGFYKKFKSVGYSHWKDVK